MYPRAPTSVVLEDLLGEACAEKVTLDWLMGRLGGRSFGLVLLLVLLGRPQIAPCPPSSHTSSSRARDRAPRSPGTGTRPRVFR
jgi:hypothetical protein